MLKSKNDALEWIGVYKKDGSLLSVYPTVDIASTELNVPPSMITQTINGELPFLNNQLVLQYDYSKTKSDIQSVIESRNQKDENERPTKAVRPIFQYDKKGNFIRAYDSIVEAVKYIPVSQASISLCINGRIQTVKGYILLRANDSSETSKKEVEKELEKRLEALDRKKAKKETIEKPVEPHAQSKDLEESLYIEKTKRKKLVNMYHFDKNGSYLGIFSNVQEVFNILGVSSPTLRSVCVGRKSSCMQGIFLLKEDFPTLKDAKQEVKRRMKDIPKRGSRRKKKSFEVSQFNWSGELVQTYPSTKEVSETLNISYGQLNQVLNGHIKEVKGFAFLYSKDFESHDEMVQEVLERKELSPEKIRERFLRKRQS